MDQQPMSPHTSINPQPTTAQATPSLPQASNDVEQKPMPVVKVLSVRGVEYGMMTLTLWFGAISLGWVSVALANGGSGAGFDMLAFPISTLLVSVPVFAFFFLRLRKAELADPSLKLEPSKRRWSQVTQFLAFWVSFGNLVSLVYTLINSASKDNNDSLSKTLATSAIILVIAGGILVYYWRDEHKKAKV